MRILGKCPICKKHDVIYTGEGDTIVELLCALCTACDHAWFDWLELIEEEGARGNILIPVEVEVTPTRVVVRYPEPHFLPFQRSMTLSLCVAAARMFDLILVLNEDGFVSRMLRPGGNHRPFMALVPNHRRLGLSTGDERSRHADATRVLAWYGNVLRVLLEDDVGSRIVRSKGEQVIAPRLSPLMPLYEMEMDRCVLAAMERVTGDAEFVSAVKDTCTHLRKSFGHTYTYEERGRRVRLPRK